MITFDGRQFARAFLAVQLFSSDDDARPALYRTVHIEEFTGRGARLVATDSFGLTTCWVAPIHYAWEDEPSLDEIPSNTATVSDPDHRVRDLMRHVARRTRKSTDPAVTVVVDLDVSTFAEAIPTLAPELAPVRAMFEIPGSEQIMTDIIDGDFPNWRTLAASFDTADPDPEATTILDGSMAARFAKIPAIYAADALRFQWLTDCRASWSLLGAAYDFPDLPGGYFMTKRLPAAAS